MLSDAGWREATQLARKALEDMAENNAVRALTYPTKQTLTTSSLTLVARGGWDRDDGHVREAWESGSQV